MIVIWGSRLYGKCDVVPGLCHVATKFGHLWFIPLIPLGTWIVLSKDEEGWRGKEIGLSFKSCVLAWLRMICIGGIISGVFMTIVSAEHGSQNVLLAWLMLSIVCAGILVSGYYIPGLGKANHARARQLVKDLGLDEHWMLLIDRRYGLISSSHSEWESGVDESGLLSQDGSEFGACTLMTEQGKPPLAFSGTDSDVLAARQRVLDYLGQRWNGAPTDAEFAAQSLNDLGLTSIDLAEVLLVLIDERKLPADRVLAFLAHGTKQNRKEATLLRRVITLASEFGPRDRLMMLNIGVVGAGEEVASFREQYDNVQALDQYCTALERHCAVQPVRGE